ncbi:hypothetical protein [Bacillus paranthracis]|uniref:hypothetical protein n=1 Tax=Bacillus paranthracis TaxID=2026186 RepID=UPI0013D5118C|nr:hypothetical protein [Bacillus paranthracis]MDK7446671.1 hypothetical protein [Bacillus paranthracis]MDN8630733.1 hypothetical protein [Bacillus paranthracis]MDN8637829.1 hypothetical protein [Bacillus paranthracis]HDR7855461.1 hypothetical protein [Bacillus paranthracis]
MKSFIGYHGTDSVSANKIMKTKFRNDSTKVGWLGQGVYFFEENYALAKYWAGRYGEKSVNVIRSEICIPEKLVFDVTDTKGKNNKFFHEMKRQLIEKKIKEENIDVFTKSERDFDGKTYNLICEMKNYELVVAPTYTFTEQDRKYGTFSRLSNGTELCLRNIKYIVTKEIV